MLFTHLITILLSFFVVFFLIRGANFMYIEANFKKRQRKRIKYSNFKEWVLYKSHYPFLPKGRIVWYFVNFAFFGISVILIITFDLFGLEAIATKVLLAYFWTNAVWALLNSASYLF